MSVPSACTSCFRLLPLTPLYTGKNHCGVGNIRKCYVLTLRQSESANNCNVLPLRECGRFRPWLLLLGYMVRTRTLRNCPPTSTGDTHPSIVVNTKGQNFSTTVVSIKGNLQLTCTPYPLPNIWLNTVLIIYSVSCLREVFELVRFIGSKPKNTVSPPHAISCIVWVVTLAIRNSPSYVPNTLIRNTVINGRPTDYNTLSTELI